eukprot:3481443-Amphidinium_carterae.1
MTSLTSGSGMWMKQLAGCFLLVTMADEANQAAVQKSDPRMLCTVAPVLPLVAGVAWFSQILHAGKTAQVLPNAVWDRIFVDHTDNRWQSVDSLLRFTQWMDGKVNESTPNLPWLIVLDAAPVHVAVDFRKRLYTDLPWVKLCFLNAGATSISQPLDRQIMRPTCATKHGTSCLFKAELLKETQDMAGQGLLIWKGSGAVPPELAPCQEAVEEENPEEDVDDIIGGELAEDDAVTRSTGKALLSQAQRLMAFRLVYSWRPPQ